MKRLFVFEGADRCANAVAYVLGVDEASARQRLLRCDASPFFVIGRAYPLGPDLQVSGVDSPKEKKA